jgi:hypothetical protein
MREKWMAVAISLISICAFLGCKSEPKLKPPAHPEELKLPPLADQRYSSPDYPKAAFKSDNDKKKDPDELPGMAGRSMSGPNRLAAGGGMPY